MERASSKTSLAEVIPEVKRPNNSVAQRRAIDSSLTSPRVHEELKDWIFSLNP